MSLTPTVVQDRQRDTTQPIILPVCLTGVNTVDISQLLQGGPKLITSAQLTMDEKPWKWTDGDGYFRAVAGCVAAVGVASTDFVADPPTGNNLYSNDTYLDVTPGAATR